MHRTLIERSREDLGRSNRRSVLTEILRGGSVHRTRIAERTGLTAASVSRITRDLIDRGLVVETAAANPKAGPGPRFVELELNSQAGYVIGIGCNAFFQWVTLANLQNEVIARRELGIASFEDPEAVLETLAAAVEDVIVESGIDRSRILGGAIALAGAIDPYRGEIRSSPTLGWGQVEVVSFFEQRLSLPFCIESIPNAVNLAESRTGLARENHNVVLVSASLGVAASLLLDDQLRRGRDYSAGLIGEQPMYWAKLNGETRSDTVLNDAAGGWAILGELDGVARGRAVPKVGGVDTALRLLEYKELAERGDIDVINAFKNCGRMLGQAVQSIVTLLQPEVALLSGPLAWMPAYVCGVCEGYETGTAGRSDPIPLKVSQLTSEAAARSLALDEFLLNRSEALNNLYAEAS